MQKQLIENTFHKRPANFVFVPKFGTYRIHWLSEPPESCIHHMASHNTVFNHHNRLSGEVLYARFALVLTDMVKNMGLEDKDWNFKDPDDPNVPWSEIEKEGKS